MMDFKNLSYLNHDTPVPLKYYPCISTDHNAVKTAFPCGEAVKEPHFWDFRQRKINSLRVKNHPFREFFYSLGAWERVKHRFETLAFFAPLAPFAPFALPFRADGLSRITEIISLYIAWDNAPGTHFID